jgi:riboflavin kinase/FMN adenylyltransferase
MFGMKFTFGAWDKLSGVSPCALTFGNFDGVHRGHQAILKALKQAAQQRGLPVSVLLFEPQPVEFFKGVQATVRLTSLRDKLRLLSQFGVDQVYCFRFNEAVAHSTPDFFVHELLLKQLNAAFILVGEDGRFGRERSGDTNLLMNMVQQAGKAIQIFPNYHENQDRISSTMIRHALAQGQLTRAAQLLGRTYGVIGKVKHGDKIGRQIGVPTANLHLRYPNPPMRGVFVVEVVEESGRITQGVANWGKRPTLDGERTLLEVHGFQLEGSLYGSWLEVRFLKKLRDEQKFPSFEALVKQIHQDVADAKGYLNERITQ